MNLIDQPDSNETHAPKSKDLEIRSGQGTVRGDSSADRRRASGRRAIASIRAWTREVEDYGWPHFDEFAQRLESARDDILGALSADAAGSSGEKASPAAIHEGGGNSGSAEDCAELTARYEHLIQQLRGSHLCFVSWQAACRAFEAVCEQYRVLAEGRPGSHHGV